ncbi:MAG TPA: methyltransferase domain-containing protein [Thermoanaerobaculia bacterium]|nr:methyltransferase domain-containing protein [Thermoanaerobaculia bacterium]
MMLTRSIINRIRYVLEDLFPPFLRDSGLFYALMHVVLRGRTRHFVSFRPRSPYMSAREYDEFYREYTPLLDKTDLNEACIARIRREVEGERALDVGCGRGYFAGLLASETATRITAVDFQVAPALRGRYPNVKFVQGTIERLPFRDAQFDTVICAHTLEHILGFENAVAELRRVCAKKLILVVPREREYKYSFNLHVHFFPYEHSLLNRLHPLPPVHACEVVDGDLLYIEDRAL